MFEGKVDLFRGLTKADDSVVSFLTALVETVYLSGTDTIYTENRNSLISVIKHRFGKDKAQEGREVIIAVREQAKTANAKSRQENLRKLTAMLSARLCAGISADTIKISKLLTESCFSPKQKECMSPDLSLAAERVYVEEFGVVISKIKRYYHDLTKKERACLEQELTQKITALTESEQKLVIGVDGEPIRSGQVLIRAILSKTLPTPIEARGNGRVWFNLIKTLSIAGLFYMQDVEMGLARLVVWMLILCGETEVADEIKQMPSYVDLAKTPEHIERELEFSRTLNAVEELELDVFNLKSELERVSDSLLYMDYGLKEEQQKLEELELKYKNTNTARTELLKFNKEEAELELSLIGKTESLHYMDVELLSAKAQLSQKQSYRDAIDAEVKLLESQVEATKEQYNETLRIAIAQLKSRAQYVEDVWRMFLPQTAVSKNALRAAATILSWDRCKIESELKEVFSSKLPIGTFTHTFDITSDFTCVIRINNKKEADTLIETIEFIPVTKYYNCPCLPVEACDYALAG